MNSRGQANCIRAVCWSIPDVSIARLSFMRRLRSDKIRTIDMVSASDESLADSMTVALAVCCSQQRRLASNQTPHEGMSFEEH